MWISDRSPNTFDVILRARAINKAVKGSQAKRGRELLRIRLEPIHCLKQMPIVAQISTIMAAISALVLLAISALQISVALKSKQRLDDKCTCAVQMQILSFWLQPFYATFQASQSLFTALWTNSKNSFQVICICSFICIPTCIFKRMCICLLPWAGAHVTGPETNARWVWCQICIWTRQACQWEAKIRILLCSEMRWFQIKPKSH